MADKNPENVLDLDEVFKYLHEVEFERNPTGQALIRIAANCVQLAFRFKNKDEDPSNR